MCFKNIKSLIEQKQPSPRAKNLYLWLKADAEEKQTRTVWFKQSDLAQVIGVSVRTLQRLLKELVDMKMIVKKEEKHEKKFVVYGVAGTEISIPPSEKGARGILHEATTILEQIPQPPFPKGDLNSDPLQKGCLLITSLFNG